MARVGPSIRVAGHASPCWSASAHADEGVHGDDVVVGRGSDRGSKAGRDGAASRAHLGRAAACPKARDQPVDGGGGVSVQLNERVLPSSSSYLLRVLHSFFAAGSKMALRHNFTKKTYERDGALRLDVFPPCDVHPGTAPGWHEVETQVLDLYHAGMEALMPHASVPDQALLASRRHASRQQQQEAQGVPRSAAVEPQIEMIHERGADEPGEDGVLGWFNLEYILVVSTITKRFCENGMELFAAFAGLEGAPA